LKEISYEDVDSGWGPVAICYEYDNEQLGSREGREFHDHQSDYQLLMKDFIEIMA
jgi:hypothetical protein